MKNQNHILVKATALPILKRFMFSLVIVCAMLNSKGQTHTPVTAKISSHIKGYWEYLPADYNSSKKNYPVLIFFHGIGEMGSGSTKDLQKVLKNGPPALINKGKFPKSFKVNGKTSSFIVISPQFTNSTRSVPEIDKLIKYIQAKYRTDNNRIYLTGLSQGGGTSWFYCSQTPKSGKKLAAMVVVCGNLPAGDNYVANVAKSNLPVWITHNKGDNKVNINTTSIPWNKKLNAYKPSLSVKSTLTIFDKYGHDAWTQTYNPEWRPNGLNVYEWLLQYSRGNAPEETNSTPVAAIETTTEIILPVNSVTLDGTSSKDSDGSIKTYAWKLLSGPAGYKLSATNKSKVKLTKLVAGTYKVELTVTDNKGATGTATESILVRKEKANEAPVAVINTKENILLPLNSVTLDGSGSKDSDGAIKSYTWKYLSGPSIFKFSALTGAKVVLSKLIAGTYKVQLTVKDNKGATGVTTATIGVKEEMNETPVAVIVSSANNLTLPDNEVKLDATDSKDKDGSVKRYSWKVASGPAKYKFTLTNGNRVTLRNLVAGTYKIQLTVTDNKGAEGTATQNITVKAAAKPGDSNAPVAVIKGAHDVILPQNSIELDGSSSKEGSAPIQSYFWEYVSGPGGYAFYGTANPKVTVAKMWEGTRVFKLTVTDTKGRKNSATVSVSVKKKSAKNTAALVVNPSSETLTLAEAPMATAAVSTGEPVAIITGAKTLTLPDNSVTLSGTSSTAGAAPIQSYSWKFVSGPGGYVLNGTAKSVLTVSKMYEGTRTFQLTVTDTKGLKSTATVSVTVQKAGATPVNAAPIANIQGTTSLVLPSNATVLDGTTSTDADGTIQKYTWSKVSGPATVTVSGSGTSKLSLTGMVEGTYSYKLTVTDDQGATGTSTATIVVASATSNKAPVATIKSVAAITLPANSVTLDGTGSTDSDGTISKYAWSYVSGPTTYSFSSTTASKVTLSGLTTAGTYVMKLIVTDDDGATASANVSVVVNPAAAPPPPPSTDCGCNITITPPSNGSVYAKGKDLGVKPGDVVCIKAGTYRSLQFTDFNGTADKPIIFKNCGGQVIVNGVTATAIAVYTSSYFKFTGSGTSAKYGFKITTPTAGSYSTIGMKVSMQCTNFEVERMEIQRASVGIMIKTEPTCDPLSWKGNYTMRNIDLHDMYIHDTQGEAFYCGYTFGSYTITCDGVKKTVYPQFIDGLKVHHNITDSTYWDGIQIGHATNVLVYENKVTNYGLGNSGGQTVGIIFNPGSTGKMYNNTIMNGYGPGIQIMGQGKIYAYNNLILNPGMNKVAQNGIFIDDRPEPTPQTLTVFIANNSIINAGKNAIYFLNSSGTVGTDNHFYNNYGVIKDNYLYKLLECRFTYTAANNLLKVVNTTALASTSSYLPTSTSPTVDAGKDLTSYGITSDLLSVARPQNGKFDIGAYEYTGAAAKTTTAIASAEGEKIQAVVGKEVGYKPGLFVTPVPARDYLTLTLNDKATGKVAVKIIDAGGRLAILDNKNIKDNANWQSRLDVSRLTPGVYYYDVQVGTSRFTGKFIKLKD
ncbi:PKD domain-containing protein [Foetidibacter luteolus]|uniref:PKD domain-containing protein n=1 Tax=Foetidibacter luteolus TaxID=2608880 RepID=UPI00129BB3FF|nr:PKD domain-containing protein [Foetidibacter luteolus]